MTAPPAYRRFAADARRRSLVEACSRVLARTGVGGASVRSIAQEAGVSPGLVGHHFAGVDALIAATYAHVGEQVEAALEHAVTAAGPDPRARLEAFVTASFRPPIAARDLLATWIAFWSLVISRPDIASQHDAQNAAFRARLEALLANCGVPASQLRPAAIGVTALVDGLWLELCLSPDRLTADQAAAIARDNLHGLLLGRRD